jgi:hypothetical protein
MPCLLPWLVTLFPLTAGLSRNNKPIPATPPFPNRMHAVTYAYSMMGKLFATTEKMQKGLCLCNNLIILSP